MAGAASDAWPGRAAGRQAAAAIRFAEEIFRASLTELEACQLPAAAAQAVFSKAAFRGAEKELAEVRKAGCRLIHWDESEYPKRLLEIYDLRHYCISGEMSKF